MDSRFFRLDLRVWQSVGAPGRCVPRALGRWGALDAVATFAPWEKLSQVSEQVCVKRPKCAKLLERL